MWTLAKPDLVESDDIRRNGRKSGAHAPRQGRNPPARETREYRTPRARDSEDSYSATEMPNTGHRGQMSAEPMSELNSDVMDEEKAAWYAAQ